MKKSRNSPWVLHLKDAFKCARIETLDFLSDHFSWESWYTKLRWMEGFFSYLLLVCLFSISDVGWSKCFAKLLLQVSTLCLLLQQGMKNQSPIFHNDSFSITRMRFFQTLLYSESVIINIPCHYSQYRSKKRKYYLNKKTFSFSLPLSYFLWLKNKFKGKNTDHIVIVLFSLQTGSLEYPIFIYTDAKRPVFSDTKEQNSLPDYTKWSILPLNLHEISNSLFLFRGKNKLRSQGPLHSSPPREEEERGPWKQSWLVLVALSGW